LAAAGLDVLFEQTDGRMSHPCEIDLQARFAQRFRDLALAVDDLAGAYVAHAAPARAEAGAGGAVGAEERVAGDPAKQTPPPPLGMGDPLVRFLCGAGAVHEHIDFDVRRIYGYLSYLWRVLRPRGTILGMGIEKRTPKCMADLLAFPAVERLIHVELDGQRPVETSDREQVIWGTDLLDHLRGCADGSYGGVVMWHGPEHMEKEAGREAIRQAIRVATDWVVVSCPWDRLAGWQAQPEGREDLGHKSVWTEKDFLELGLRTLTCGQRNVYPSYMLGWRMPRG
jgi:hypothetical protein